MFVVFYFLIILRRGKEEKMDTNTATIIAIIVGVLFAVTVTIILMCLLFERGIERIPKEDNRLK